MKAQRLYNFIVVFLLLSFNATVLGQSRHLSVVPAPIEFVSYNLLKPDTVETSLPTPTLFTPAFSLVHVNAVIEPDYYTRCFGFFCKKELQFEKATAIPLKFRLGTLDYVNKLEGK